MTQIKKRNWIFILLIFIGLIMTIILVASQTNLIYKNSDFSKKVVFYGDEGISGYLVLERNSKTPSTVSWTQFENNKSKIFFSEDIIIERVSVDIPSKVESGIYYFNVRAVFSDGEEEIKEIKFKII